MPKFGKPGNGASLLLRMSGLVTRRPQEYEPLSRWFCERLTSTRPVGVCCLFGAGALIEVLLRARVRRARVIAPVVPAAVRMLASSARVIGSSVASWPFCCGERQHIHLAHLLNAADRHVVAEPSLLRARMQDRPRPRRLGRLIELLHVEEEERLVAAVEEAGDDDRAAEPPAVLVDDDLVAARGRGSC